MKYKHELIGKKVLIICDCDGISIHRIYCAYILGEIIKYNPDKNEINIRIVNTDYYILYKLFYSKLGNHTYFEFTLNMNDPFVHIYSDNRLAYKEPKDYNKLWYYIVYSDNEAISLLKNNLSDKEDKPVYGYAYLSTDCYYKQFKSKKKYLTYLLHELSNENSK